MKYLSLTQSIKTSNSALILMYCVSYRSNIGRQFQIYLWSFSSSTCIFHIHFFATSFFLCSGLQTKASHHKQRITRKTDVFSSHACMCVQRRKREDQHQCQDLNGKVRMEKNQKELNIRIIDISFFRHFSSFVILSFSRLVCAPYSFLRFAVATLISFSVSIILVASHSMSLLFLSSSSTFFLVVWPIRVRFCFDQHLPFFCSCLLNTFRHHAFLFTLILMPFRTLYVFIVHCQE